MKIRVTKTELLQLLTKALEVSITEVVIAKESILADKITEKLKERVPGLPSRIVSFESFQPDKKIPAIKALREIVPGLGLAEAKAAIETWENWIGFVKEHGRTPKMSFTMY